MKICFPTGKEHLSIKGSLRHKFKLRAIFVFLFSFSSSFIFAQRTITGQVTSGDTALAGVTVQVKGGSAGTQTGPDGTFQINAPANATLVFSSIGFTTREVAVKNQSVLNLQLQSAIQNMNEVVVVGYGSQKRSTFAGAVSTVTTKELTRNPAGNLSNSLVGNAPGIIAVQRSGEPGRDQSDVFIRGIGTTGNSSPLYVVDGIVSTQSDFAQINANEIASISILKDAASAAVFGVRGGNGIILVTTKRGTSGRTLFSYNFNYGVQQRTRTPSYVGSYDYATLFNEARVNDGSTPTFTDADLQKFQDGSDPNGHPNTNWYETVLKKTAPMLQHNLSANGGTEKLRYALSLSYLDQDGIYSGSGFKRYNFRSNLDADVTNTTRISFDLSGRNENRFEPSIGASDLFSALGRVRPIDAAQFTNGLYSRTIQGNPLASTQSSEGYNQNRLWGMRARTQILQSIPFVEGLSIKGIAAFNKTFEEGKRWSSPTISLYSYNPTNQTFAIASPANAASLSQNNNSGQHLTLEAHLNYDRAFGDHKISALLLYTETEERFSGLGASRQQYAIRVDELNLGPVNSFTGNSGFSGSSGRRGYVGRVNYTYGDRYIIEGSFRRDASEQFAKEKRWGFFPSVSAAWVISNEQFFPKTSAVNFLKLRGSWGVLGNDRVSNNTFLYISSYTPTPPSVGNVVPAIFGGSVAQQTIYEGRLGNPNVTWETVKKLDIGLDASLFKGLLSLTADYFFDKRSDILERRSASVPALAGFSLPVENLAKVNNKGIDLALSHRNTVGRSFTYNLTVNFTYAKNEVIFVDEPAGTNPNIARTGRQLNSQFGYQAIGLFKDTMEIKAAPKQTSLGTPPKPGDIRYADISGPAGKPDGIIDANDRTVIGRSNIPEIIYGITGGIGFKGLELSFLLQGSERTNQYLSNETAWPFFNGGNALKENFDRWTPATPNGKQPRVTLNTGSPNYQTSSFWIKDASYLRLRSVELAYSIPKNISNKMRLQGLRVYANANNVFTISEIKNFDPENSNPRGWAYPQLRVFNFGATVQF